MSDPERGEVGREGAGSSCAGRTRPARGSAVQEGAEPGVPVADTGRAAPTGPTFHASTGERLQL